MWQSADVCLELFADRHLPYADRRLHRLDSGRNENDDSSGAGAQCDLDLQTWKKYRMLRPQTGGGHSKGSVLHFYDVSGAGAQCHDHYFGDRKPAGAVGSV